MPRPRLHLDPIPEVLPPEPRALVRAVTRAQVLRRRAQGHRILADADELEAELEERAQAPAAAPDCPWITAAEAARRLGRHKSTVNRLIAAGAIPTRLVGHLRYVDWPAFTERKEAKD